MGNPKDSKSRPAEGPPAYMQDTPTASLDATLDSAADSKSDSDPIPVPVTINHSVDGDISTPLNYTIYRLAGAALATEAHITEDGTISVTLKSRTTGDQKLPELPEDYGVELPEYAIDSSALEGKGQVPGLGIVIQIVGSRGDVQPFLALGQALHSAGHRVRIATHPTFKSSVLDSSLEFFSIGGDPEDLMAYMVKNPGLIPGFESLRNGDIPRKRKMIKEILEGCWKSCFQPGEGEGAGEGFVADAIIMNPPSFAGVHCAEALGVPVHTMFTMPWCSTTAFPHPLVGVKSAEGIQPGLLNYLTYGLADMLSWQGLGDVINEFRTKTLALESLALRSGPNLAERLRIPWTYCWSPSLIPKPKDWRSHIDVCGFWFQDGKTGYEPPEDLKAFLEQGEEPVYIGFGSVPVSDPEGMTKTIFEAVKRSKTRALVSAGWGKLGGSSVPSNVFILGNCPHDWLFSRVSAVVHHGGAGTTAIGLQMGKPTVIVPFFGDQGFWGDMVHEAGAGPAPIPHKTLTADNLTAALEFALRPDSKIAAEKMGEAIRNEDGVNNGVASFHKHLPLLNMRCDFEPSLVAVWYSEKYCLQFSTFAAQVLVEARQLSYNDLTPSRAKEYLSRAPVTDPVTGGGSAILKTVVDYYSGIAKSFVNPVKGVPLAIIAIPRGVASIVGKTSEGLRNAPKLYGGQVRKMDDPKNFGDGMVKGIQGLGYGYLDAVTGLVSEPMRGAKAEGGLGFIKGSARGILNASLKPAAGALGLVEHPARGIIKSFKKMGGISKANKAIIEIRKSQGKAAIKARDSQKSEIVAKWKTEKEKGRVEERRKAKVQKEKELGASIGLKVVDAEDVPPEDFAPDSPTSESGPSGSSPSPPEMQPNSPPGPETASNDQAQFDRDMDTAKQLSLAEQRGYERGMAQGGG